MLDRPVSSENETSGRKEFLLSRLPALAAIAVLAALLAWGKHHFGHLFQIWRLLRIPAINQPFADMRFIMYAIDFVRTGGNPYTNAIYDPWLRPFNYPPIWLDLRYLGVHSSSSNLMGSLSALAGLGGCVALFRARTRLAGVLIFFAMLCWPLLFAIERGNTVLILFPLLVFGALLIGPARTRSTTVLRSVLVIGLTVLKVYPVAASVALLRNRGAIRTAAITAVLAVAALVATCGHDLRYLLANTPQVTLTSFGAFPFLMAVGKHLGAGFEQTIKAHEILASLFALTLGLTAILLGGLGRRRLRSVLPEVDLESARGFLAVSGLALYCLNFTRGAGYDYWLIFLLAPLMYLIEDLNRGESRRALPAALVLLAFLWSPYLGSPLLQEVLDVAVFVGGCAWLGATLTNHLRPGGTERAESAAMETRGAAGGSLSPQREGPGIKPAAS